jgi:hypothetical protein
MLQSCGATVVYAVRRWEKRRYAAHTCTLRGDLSERGSLWLIAVFISFRENIRTECVYMAWTSIWFYWPRLKSQRKCRTEQYGHKNFNHPFPFCLRPWRDMKAYGKVSLKTTLGSAQWDGKSSRQVNICSRFLQWHCLLFFRNPASCQYTCCTVGSLYDTRLHAIT